MNNNFCSKCIGGRTKGTKAKKRWYGERRGNEDTEGACDDKEGAVRKKKGQWGWRRGNKDKERAVRLNKEQWGRKSKDKLKGQWEWGAVRTKKEQWGWRKSSGDKVRGSETKKGRWGWRRGNHYVRFHVFVVGNDRITNKKKKPCEISDTV